MTFTTVITVLTPKKRMTIIGVAYLVAVFAFVDKGTIQTMLGFLKPATIFTKFVIWRFINEITVSTIGSEIGKFTVFILGCDDIDLWYATMELSELFKKWSVKIKIRAVVQRIPIIAPPHFLIVDGIRLIRRVERYDGFFCFITFSLVQFSLISPGKSSTFSFFWRESWRGYEIFYPWENRRLFIVILEILISHKKIFSRYLAFFGFYYLISGGYETHKIW